MATTIQAKKSNLRFTFISMSGADRAFQGIHRRSLWFIIGEWQRKRAIAIGQTLFVFIDNALSAREFAFLNVGDFRGQRWLIGLC